MAIASCSSGSIWGAKVLRPVSGPGNDFLNGGNGEDFLNGGLDTDECVSGTVQLHCEPYSGCHISVGQHWTRKRSPGLSPALTPPSPRGRGGIGLRSLEPASGDRGHSWLCSLACDRDGGACQGEVLTPKNGD
jgi:RTX calcium-binding nonapeptide repeat (4 copies)